MSEINPPSPCYRIALLETEDSFRFKCYGRKYFTDKQEAEAFRTKFNEGLDPQNVDWYCFADGPYQIS